MELSFEGKNLSKKNEFLAGFMSAIVPGSGKIYAKRQKDGIISLITILVSSWQAYDGFKKDGIKSVKGWIYSTLSTFFYLGNIYGSIVAVKIHNQQVENKYFHKVELTINAYF
jgi:TM2 domain-containing membrane protein YozV